MPPDFGFTGTGSFNQMGFPSGVRFPVSAAKIQSRPRWNGSIAASSTAGFSECLRLAHCQSLRQTSSPPARTFPRHDMPMVVRHPE